MPNSSRALPTIIRPIRVAWGIDERYANRSSRSTLFAYNAAPVTGVEQGACHVLQQFLLSSAVANAAKASLPNSASRKAIASFVATRN